jgi:hypothetical protein
LPKNQALTGRFAQLVPIATHPPEPGGPKVLMSPDHDEPSNERQDTAARYELHVLSPGGCPCSSTLVSVQHPLSSIGRRNSLPEHLGWFHPIQGLSRAVVQLPGDGIEVRRGVEAEVGRPREVLAQ